MSFHKEMLKQLIQGTDWEVSTTGQLICKHGYTIEKDGECPEGCVSILKQKGFV